MTEAAFDKYIDEQLDKFYNVGPDDRVNLKFDPLCCDCDIWIPVRDKPKTPQETLRRAECMAEMTWRCVCPGAIHDYYSLLRARRAVVAQSCGLVLTIAPSQLSRSEA